MLITEILPDKLLIKRKDSLIAEKLEKSIAAFGILAPVLLCDGLVVDGHQRLACALNCGITSVETVNVCGTAEMLYLELNRHRNISPGEIVALLRRVNHDSEMIAKILAAAGLTSTPQLLKVFNFLADCESFTDENLNALPVNVWRELGHLQTDLQPVAEWLVKLPATMAEKRLIAGMLRQADRRKALPQSFSAENGTAAIAWLAQIVQPRRSETMQKVLPLLESKNVPAGISVKIDPTFEKPGLEMQIHLTRNHLDRFAEAEKLARELFARVEEL